MGKRLLVRVPNWLGDCVMSLRALAGLFRAWPDTAFWCAPRVAGLLPVFFPAAEAIPLEAHPGSSFGRLLLLTDSFGSAYRGWKSGIPERIGHSGQMRSAFLSRRLRPVPGRDHHHSLDYERLASFCGAEPGPVPAPSVEPVGEGHVAIFAGAAYGAAKVWPGFADVFGRLGESSGLPLVLYGTPAEASDLRRIAGAGAAAVETDLDLGGLCARLRSARLALGNDSGGVHLAAALGVPTIALFGSTSPVWTAPHGAEVRILAGSASCSPCYERTCRKGEMTCFDGIGLEDVLAACGELLGAQTGEP